MSIKNGTGFQISFINNNLYLKSTKFFLIIHGALALRELKTTAEYLINHSEYDAYLGKIGNIDCNIKSETTKKHSITAQKINIIGKLLNINIVTGKSQLILLNEELKSL